MRWRKRHPFPRHHDERSGQDQGTAHEQDRIRRVKDKKSVPSTCPTGQTLTAIHGQPEAVLSGPVLRMSCSSQALDTGSIPVTHSNTKAQA
jgi:hypothetical protein